jgi:selenocysteine lyase/cysteine desulfurase
MNKRTFLGTASGAALGLFLDSSILARDASQSSNKVVEDGDFWTTVRSNFRLTDDYINLENGWYGFQPETVLEAFIGHIRAVNLEASHYMSTRKDADKLRVRAKLAAFAGCSTDELIITRNTTESIDTVVHGIEWHPGDEAVMANQEYPAMIDMFKLQGRRYGIVNRFVDIPVDPKSDREVVEVYERALTAKTRLLMISHMVYITGQILPVRAICDMAHSHGVEVIVDGAHTFAHLDFLIPDLHCDYYGASLHKWLLAPLGAGILYVRREHIAKLWPMFADDSIPPDDIRKLNHTGTHPVHTDLTIEQSLAYHQMIGSSRKEARLRYLQSYWTSKVRGTDRIVLNTPVDSGRSCAIANVGVVGIEPRELQNALLKNFSLYTSAVVNRGVDGVRVTPQIYTSTADLDTLVFALKSLAS